MYPIPILTPAQSAAWDQAAEAHGIAGATLMETAGRAVAQVVATRFAARLGQGVLIACGTGNNGGDGWVVARALHRLGCPVWVAAVEGPASPLSAAAADRARADGVRQVAPDGPWPAAGLLVDAVLGTGAKGPPRERPPPSCRAWPTSRCRSWRWTVRRVSTSRPECSMARSGPA